MSEVMNIGIIGAGTIANSHIAAMKHLSETANVTAICDVDTKLAKEKADPLGASVFSDYKEMLENGNIDVALVCLPHYLHHPVGIDILNHGIHLFLEKPMANTVHQCRELIDAVNRNGKTLFVGQTHQYRSVMIKARELIQNGTIGEPRMIYDEIVAYYNWEKRKPWFLDPKKAGGGALFNTSPHQVDHLLYLIDSSLTKVRANVSALRPGETVDSDAMAFVEYENGVQGFMGIFSGTKLTDSAKLELRVLGTKGSIRLNPFSNEIQIGQMNKVEIVQADPDHDPIAAEWKECITSIRENRPPATDGIYGHNVVAVLEAMVKSSTTKSEVVPELL